MSTGRQVGEERLPEGRRRPSPYLPPYWESLKTASHASCCRLGSRKSADVGSSRLSLRLLNKPIAFGDNFSSKSATCPYRSCWAAVLSAAISPCNLFSFGARIS